MIKRFSGSKGLIVIVALLVMIVGYFYYLSNRTYTYKEKKVVLTPIQEVLTMDFNIKYPPTPKEVVKTYLDITKVMYNESLSDEEIDSAALKLQEIFDDELVANQSEEAYLSGLKLEISNFKSGNNSIVNQYTSSSTEVEEYTMDGFRLAKLYGTFTIRTETGSQSMTNVFVLRKDSRGRWKIYGFQPVDREAGA